MVCHLFRLFNLCQLTLTGTVVRCLCSSLFNLCPMYSHIVSVPGCSFIKLCMFRAVVLAVFFLYCLTCSVQCHLLLMLNVVVSFSSFSFSMAHLYGMWFVKEMVCCALCNPIVLLIDICILGENKVKAGQLRVMEALLESLTSHKASQKVGKAVACALGQICGNGI